MNQFWLNVGVNPLGAAPWTSHRWVSHQNLVFSLLWFYRFAVQLKVYEDDFRRERSDKQMLQRLLLKKTPQNKDPVLVHRCNNEQQPPGGDKRTQSGEKRKQHHPLCPKHPNRDKESDWELEKNKKIIITDAVNMLGFFFFFNVSTRSCNRFYSGHHHRGAPVNLNHK